MISASCIFQQKIKFNGEVINYIGQGIKVILEEGTKDSQQKLTSLFTVFSKRHEINVLLKIK
jgi:hypothetical protein